jgi:hypothetical protein
MAKSNGAYVATMDSIEQGAKDLVVDSIAYEYPKFKLEMKAIGAKYDAKLNGSATEITGQWNQFSTLPLTLKRTTSPDVIPEPLTAEECAQRKDSDLQGVWQSDFKTNGTLLPTELKISEPVKGTFRAELACASLGVTHLPATTVSYEGTTVAMDFDGMGGSFNGKMMGGKTRMEGTVKIGDGYHLATFSRVDTQAQAARDLEKDYSHNGLNDLPGHWKGTLTVKQAKLRLKLDIARMADGTYDCIMTSVDQGGAQIPATAVSFAAPKATMEWSGIAGAFIGDLKNGKLSGTWSQSTVKFPLTFERSEK